VFTTLQATDGSGLGNLNASSIVGLQSQLQDLSSNSVTANYGVFTTLEHQGLIFTEGAEIDQVVRANVTMTLGTAWQDLPTPPLPLGNAVYALALVANTEMYMGSLSWYGGLCASNTTDELILHRAGTGLEPNRVYARTARQIGNLMTFQLAGSVNGMSSDTYTMTFRRIV
jgi:hypothetical protein